MSISTILRPVAMGAAVLVAGALSAGIGFEAKAHAATPSSATAKATAAYTNDLGPSKAWQKAGKAERRHAERSYLYLFGSWENGCKADLRHAYQGTTAKHANVQPHLPVYRQHNPGRDILLGRFVKEVC